ncbi:MAG: hypothetical protein JW986_03715 [Methanotrichaceae archaeon]|nr:hypothetical protein [Methanotrichaceae archaeon]
MLNKHWAPGLVLVILLALAGTAWGDVSSSFSASDGESTVGFSTVYGAGLDDRIADSAKAGFSSGVSLSRALLASGSMSETHYVDDGTSRASVKAEVENAADYQYQYALFPLEGDVAPSAYVQARHWLTVLDADDIYCEEVATNTEGDFAVTTITVEDGSLQNYFGLARATATDVTTSHSADSAEGSMVLITAGARNDMSDHAYHSLTARDAGLPAVVTGLRASTYADNDFARASLDNVLVDVSDGTLDLEQGSSNSIADSSGSWTSVIDGQLSFEGKCWGDETPRAQTSIANLVADGSIYHHLLAGDVPWELLGVAGRTSQSLTHVDGHLELYGDALENPTGTSVNIAISAEGSIEQNLWGENADANLRAEAETTVEPGSLEYTGSAQASNTRTSASVDLTASAPDGSIDHSIDAGGMTEEVPAYAVDLEELSAVGTFAYDWTALSLGTLDYNGEATSWKSGLDTIALAQVNELYAHTDLGSIFHTIMAENPEGDWAREETTVEAYDGFGDLYFSGYGKAWKTGATVQGCLSAYTPYGYIGNTMETGTSLFSGCRTALDGGYDLYAYDSSYLNWGGSLDHTGTAMARNGKGGIEPSGGNPTISLTAYLDARLDTQGTIDHFMASNDGSGHSVFTHSFLNSWLEDYQTDGDQLMAQLAGDPIAEYHYSGTASALDGSAYLKNIETNGYVTGCGSIDHYISASSWPPGLDVYMDLGLIGPAGCSFYYAGSAFSYYSTSGDQVFINTPYIYGCSTSDIYHSLSASSLSYPYLATVGSLNLEASSSVNAYGGGSIEGSTQARASSSEARVVEDLYVDAGEIYHATEAHSSPPEEIATQEMESLGNNAWESDLSQSEEGSATMHHAGSAVAREGLAKVQVDDHTAYGDYLTLDAGAGDIYEYGGPSAGVDVEVGYGCYSDGTTIETASVMPSSLWYFGLAQDITGSRVASVVTKGLLASGDGIYAAHHAALWEDLENWQESTVGVEIDSGELDLLGNAKADLTSTSAYQRGSATGEYIHVYGEALNPTATMCDQAYGGYTAWYKSMRFYDRAWTNPTVADEMHGLIYT